MNIQALIEKGESLFQQGNLREAEKHFLQVIELDPENKEALNNLGVIAHQEGNPEEAVRYFTESLAIDPSYEDAVTNYTALLDEIEMARAEKRITEEESPGTRAASEHQARHRHAATPLPGRKARIAVLCLPGLESFLGDIVRFLKTRYEVRTCYSQDWAELESAVRWADLVWLEWANDLAATLTHREGLLDGKRVVCRVHSYEVLDGYLPRVNWSKIMKIIFVAPHVLDIARKIYPKIMDVTTSVVIPNGVDLDKFSFKERTPGFTLAVVGHVNNKKNPSLWPEIMHRLVRINDRYRIKIAGAVQEVRYGLYLEHAFKRLGLEKHVQFFGHVENIAKWLNSEKVNYLLTTSIFESFGYGIAEAMAMGYRPLINNFPGADGLWPAECLFSSVDDLVRMISDDDAYKPLEYRHFVEERYALPQQMIKIEELINSVMESVCSSKSVPDCPQNFPGTQSYWQNRYNKGGTSGSGSYGRLAQFKAEMLNKFVVEKNIRSVLEIGCGDGHQLSLFEFPQYLGLDISEKAISQCGELFKKDLRKNFFLYDPFTHDTGDPLHKADMVISLDVIYHLIEDELYEMYMKHLFEAAKRYVVIYSSNAEINTPSAHEKRREFTSWIETKQPDFKLVAHIPNRFPYDPSNPENTSLSDFYFFRFVEERYGRERQIQTIGSLVDEVLPKVESTTNNVSEHPGSTSISTQTRTDTPLVSIITPSLNYGKYIRQSIDSVIEQDYENMEIIVVEGGSTDSTPQILKEYGDRIRYIKQQSKGPVEAVNEGIRAAKGSLIGLLGADDLYMPGKIVFQVDVLNKNPSIDVVIGDCIIIDENGQQVTVWRHGPLPNRQELIRRTVLHNSFINGLSVLMRRDCFDMVGYFDESLRSCTDGDMWLRLLKHGCTFKHYPFIFVKHRRHGKNISGNNQAEQYVEQLRIKTLQNFTPEDLFGDILSDGKLSISSAYEQYAQILFRNSKISSAEIAMKISNQYKN